MVLKEIGEMLKKEAIIPVKDTTETWSRAISKLSCHSYKKSEGFRPVIKLKKLNSCLKYKHFQIEELMLLKKTIFSAIVPQGCLFFITSSQGLSKICKISMGGEISLSVLWLLSAPKIFTKLMKVLISIFRRLNILMILFLDDILLITRPQEEIVARIWDFWYKSKSVKRSVLQPFQKLEVLAKIVDLKEMTLSLPQEKVLTIIGQCHQFLTKDQVSVREISQLIGKMCY